MALTYHIKQYELKEMAEALGVSRMTVVRDLDTVFKRIHKQLNG